MIIPDAVRDGGLCIGYRAGLPPSAWDADTGPVLRQLAVRTCGQCPALAPCGQWLDGLPRSRRPGGVVAGRLIAAPRSDGQEVTVRAGLATATATAQRPAARKYTAAKKARNATYHRAHRDALLVRKRAYYAARADEWNAARRAARAADPEPVRAAARAAYWARRDEINARRRAARAAG